MNFKRVLIVCMMVGSVCAMKRSVELDNKNQSLTVKSLCGFPLTSLSKGPKWFSSLSERDKADVAKNIINHNDKRFEVLFNMATKLPLDLQVAIARRLYDNEQVDAFLHMPISQAYCYHGFLDIINDEKNSFFKETCSQNPYFKPDIVCGLVNEITVLSDWNDRGGGNKQRLEAIARVVETFEGSFVTIQRSIYYEFEELFTLRKFIKEDLRYLPFLLSVYIILAVPSLDICGVDEQAVKFNIVAKNFNDEAVCAYQATGSRAFLDARVELRDEHNYRFNLFIYMKMLSWISAYIPLIDLYKWGILKDHQRSGPTLKEWVGYFVGVMVCSSIFNAIALLETEFQRPFAGVPYVTVLYLFARLVYNMAVKEKRLKYDWVALDKLSALLQRTDINIT